MKWQKCIKCIKNNKYIHIYKWNYITQGCSLHSFKSSRGVGVEIVERDNIL
jgi:hypothetical protein